MAEPTQPGARQAAPRRAPGRAARHAGRSARRALQAFAIALLVPLGLAVGFTVGTDANGTFGFNGFGGYAADELFLKRSLMQHRDHDALLLGDSRAAFADPGAAGGFRFFNAGAGGANLADAAALLDAADLESLRLVVVLLPAHDLVGGCGGASRLDDPMALLREGATLDALADAVRHQRLRLSGRLPAHAHDGTRLPDARVVTPVGWDGARAERYRERVEAARTEGPLERRLETAAPCTETLQAMRAQAEAAGARLMVVLSPINADLLKASGTDTAAVRRLIRERFVAPMPFVVDLTASRFSDPSFFPPADAVHFSPQSGEEILETAIARYCRQTGGCPW